MIPMKHLPLSLLLLCLPTVLSAASPPQRPNILVMIADDLGDGDVSCLSRSVVKTPNIDRLAQMGVKFTAGYVVSPLCAPSRAGYFSGLYPQRYGFKNNNGTLPADLPLLPDVLHQAGYVTGLLGKWHSRGPRPHQRGSFDETLCYFGPFLDYHHPNLVRNGKPEASSEYSTDLFAREAELFLEKHRDRPFFLTVAFNAPHIIRVLKPAVQIRQEYDAAVAAGNILDVPKVPIARPGDAAKFIAQFPGDSARADTVATIVALDQAVGRILDKLQQTGLDRHTIVFFFSDNGGHPENRSENLPLRDYKWSFYEGGVRVPFFAVYPGVFPAGREFAQPVSTLDIFPTCAALAGAKPPANLDGVDLTPYLKGEKAMPPHNTLFFCLGPNGAVRQDRWKLVVPAGGAPQLFDLSQDLEETHDLAATEPRRVKELKAKWESWFAQMPAGPPAGEQDGGKPEPHRPAKKAAAGADAD